MQRTEVNSCGCLVWLTFQMDSFQLEEVYAVKLLGGTAVILVTGSHSRVYCLYYFLLSISVTIPYHSSPLYVIQVVLHLLAMTVTMLSHLDRLQQRHVNHRRLFQQRNQVCTFSASCMGLL